MTSTEFSESLEVLGWSMRHLAKRLECDCMLPVRWAQGRAEVPPPVATWLGKLTAYQERHPAPEDWRTRPREAR